MYFVKSFRILSFSGPYFPAFGLNTKRYEVSLRIQSECGKIRTRKNSEYGQFSRSDESVRSSHSILKLFEKGLKVGSFFCQTFRLQKFLNSLRKALTRKSTSSKVADCRPKTLQKYRFHHLQKCQQHKNLREMVLNHRQLFYL